MKVDPGVKILLVSTYDLGRQPFGLASPAAWLRGDGHEVTCADLAVGPPPVEAARAADLVAFHLPMHTATRLAAPSIRAIRALNPSAHVCCYGLYAAMNESYLRELGVQTLAGGEFEPRLLELARRLARGENGTQREPLVSLDRVPFLVPDRTGLPPLDRYASLMLDGTRRTTGYTEASRGCKHLCRHCPVVPVYNGQFRIVPVEVVLADIRQQVAAGASHISFGDPDFFNGPAHAVRIVEGLHEEFPHLTYDVTIKIEHLRQRRDLLPLLKRTGCQFVTSAVESVDDHVLARLDKGHTREDFVAVVEEFRNAGLVLSPTFIPFTPWTTREGYQDLLRVILDLGLVENVAPVQLALRLLIPNGSLMLELPEVVKRVSGFDPAALIHRWTHADASIDTLSTRTFDLVAAEQKKSSSRAAVFARIWELAHQGAARLPENFELLPRAAVPYLNEPWYC